jgi:hypothetical protein
MIFFGSVWLFLDILTSLTFLKVVLNGLKQNIFNGYKTCDAWDGRIIMFNLNSYACSIASNVTWLPWPSKTNKCQLVKDIPLGTNFFKKIKKLLEQEKKTSKLSFTLLCKVLVCKIWCNHPILFHLWKCKTMVKHMLQHLLHNL